MTLIQDGVRNGAKSPETEMQNSHLSPHHPFRLVAFLRAIFSSRASFHRDFVQADILDARPDNRQATGLCREHVNLIGALPYIAEEALNGVGGLDVAVHRLWKRKKREGVLFVLSQASDRLWIALAVLGFEGRQYDEQA